MAVAFVTLVVGSDQTSRTMLGSDWRTSTSFYLGTPPQPEEPGCRTRFRVHFPLGGALTHFDLETSQGYVELLG